MSPIPRDHASVKQLYLDTPTPADLLTVIAWRKTCPEALRTPRDITPPEQERFYQEVVCNPKSPHRYYAVREQYASVYRSPDDTFVALVSLENLSWENGHAEIGLIVDPARQGQGIGRRAVDLALEVAFDRLRLQTIWLECYFCGHPNFWQNVVRAYGGSSTIWPRRKWWAGTLHDAMLGTITRDNWQEAQRCGSAVDSGSAS